ncbi:MAG: hypothetical protein ABI813_08900 [Bacteroidota bacterium]
MVKLLLLFLPAMQESEKIMTPGVTRRIVLMKKVIVAIVKYQALG